MYGDQQSLLTRDDTFLGICEALGEDLGFNPFFLRVTLAISLLWNPTIVIAGYLAAGVVVLLSRVLFPNPRRARSQPAAARLSAAEPAADPQQAVADAEPLPVAA